MSKAAMDMAIVTSCHNYGRYIADWARSIIGCTTFMPVQCTIIDNGSTDVSPRQVEEAAKLLADAGIPTVTERIPFTCHGAGRNRAVAASGDSTWVMHLDADDMLMPHALEDIAALMPRADVIGMGYVRVGDLKAGPRNRTRTYSAHQGEATLRSVAPCSGVSPFRRKLWEKRPYRTDMRGGWDTALWIGFAHLDARFVPTLRPCFHYRQHRDSVFNKRWPSERLTEFVGVKLGNLRRKIDAGVSVIVPFRPDGAERDRAWQWVERRYAALHPNWEVVMGTDAGTGPWRKGAAIADALDRATGVTIVIADADCYAPPVALREAVELVKTHQAQWVVPHLNVFRYDRPSSEAIINGDPPEAAYTGGTLARKPYEGYAGGGVLVLDRSDYQAAGGIPFQFGGWGAEDEALAVILDTLLGTHTRLPYDLCHLWHSPVRRMRHVMYKANRNLLRLFLDRQNLPEAMWELVQHMRGGGDPYALPSHPVAKVMMVAIETFQWGDGVIKSGELFRCSEAEARRFQLRSRKMATKLNGTSIGIAQHLSGKERTLDIRAEQAERNEEIYQRRTSRQQQLTGG